MDYTGSLGAIYGTRMLETLAKQNNIETHLVVTKWGENVVFHETGLTVSALRKLAKFSYDIDDMSSAIASGTSQIVMEANLYGDQVHS